MLRAMAAGAVIGLVAGCGGGSGGPTGPTAQQAADELAAALSRGSLDTVRIHSGQPEAELPELLKGMHGLLPTVGVMHISPTEKAATIRLGYRWPLSSPWTYETEAIMVRDGSDWALKWKPEVLHPKLTATNRLERQRSESTERGNILGRDNAVIVQSAPFRMLGLDKTGLDSSTVEASARQVAEAAQVDVAGFLVKAHAAGADAFVDAAPVRQEDLPANFFAIKGAATRTVMLPAPETSGYAQALLGRVDYAGEEQARDAGAGVAPGDVVGVSGLQRTFDAQMRGSTSNRVFLAERDAPIGTGSPINDTLVADFADAPGDALETTIDKDIQTALEQSLRTLKVSASVVVLRTGTGAILAAADSPPARSQDDSTTGRLAPGLAAGPVAALALSRSGVRLSDRVQCDKQVIVGGRTFENPSSYRRGNGHMTLTNAFASECLTAVAAASARLDPPRLPEAARSLGLGHAHDVGTPTNFGDFPAPADELAKAEAAMGQGASGAVQSSALGLATMAASVQAKETVVPFLVPGREPAPQAVAPLSDAEAKTLQGLMKASAATYRPLTAVSTGQADGRSWMTGYSDTYAMAVVLADDDDAWISPAHITRAVAGAARSLR